MSPACPTAYSHLQTLLACHSTPGDEGEVAAVLTQVWTRAGWQVTRHGQYALSATRPVGAPPGKGRRPRVLVCAHMDSPGFAVECIRDGQLRLITLGGTSVETPTVATVLKTRAGKFPLELRRRAREGRGQDHFYAPVPDGSVDFGDRACFAAAPRFAARAGTVTSPFLDNRLGCALLCDLAERLTATASRPGRRRGAAAPPPVELVLGATGCEEMGGFGAPVLARAVQPDLVICLDATYEAPAQGVFRGRGPVLTLSDNSVLLSPAVRDRLQQWFQARGFPLQTEVYNYSGTDSRAFPHAGLSCPVLPLLIATRGNHTRQESANLRDYDTLLAALLTDPALGCEK